MSTLPLRADQPESPETTAIPSTFWQRPFVQDILPFLTSLVLHLGIIALGVLTYKAIKVVVTRSEPPAVLPAPVSQIDADPTNAKTLGFPDGDAPKSLQDTYANVPPDAEGLTDTIKNNGLTGGAVASDSNDADIAVGLSSSSFGRTGNKLGVGDKDGTGSGAGDGLGMAPFGPHARAIGDVSFLVKGRANKIVFLCDSSGSMMTKFDVLRVELRKAVDHLQPTQQFDIIFFAADKYIALDNQLQHALPETKRKAYDLLDKTAPHDTSDPIPGLRAAFAANPEMIFMLTDGDFPNNQQVLDEIKKLSAGKRVVVNTIAFFDRGEDYEKLLKQIADETKGTFRFVTEQELNP